jgi:hypothetical protein
MIVVLCNERLDRCRPFARWRFFDGRGGGARGRTYCADVAEEIDEYGDSEREGGGNMEFAEFTELVSIL